MRIDTPPTTPVTTKAGRREWIGLAVLILPVLLVSMDITVLYFALPSISASLHPSGTQQLWMIDIYGFVLSGLLITMGGVGDRIGRRRLLVLGSIVFGGASALAAFAGSPAVLIAARALQGVGGATLMPSTLGLIRNMFHDAGQRRNAIAVWTVGMGMGSAIGPVLSGLLLTKFWWGSIFLVNLPFIAVLLLALPLLVPEYRDRATRLDLPSALLSMGAVLPTVWALKKFAADGFSVTPAVSVAVGVVLGVAFVLRQRTHAHPMIDLTLFRRRGFGPSMSCNVVAYFTMVGFGIFTTQYLMEVLRMSPLEAALWTLASPVAIMFFAPVAVKTASVVRPAYVIVAGFLIAATGCFLVTRLGTDRNIPLIISGTVCMGVGVVISNTIVTDQIMGYTSEAQSGRVSAMLQTCQELGGALGVAVLGSIGASVFGNTMDRTIPAGLPDGALDASRQTLGGAHNYSMTLKEPQAGHLFHTAQEAFVKSLTPAGLTAIGVLAVMSVFVLISLRHVVPAAPAAPAAQETDTEREHTPAAA
ncbi:MFS transporter [Streptomyces sp. NPDC021356]|uniref:MFS transporter n=1 Tax=Streptomyces sp. NPDC021356 TaxID=3154900 RepID=UPI0033C700BC